MPSGRVLRSRRGRNRYTTDKLGHFENLVDILYRKVTFPRIRHLPLTQADVISGECLLTCGSVCLDKNINICYCAKFFIIIFSLLFILLYFIIISFIPLVLIVKKEKKGNEEKKP